jgi:predicted dehydrogenase
MKILIAGLGSIGRRHLRNLLALGEADKERPLDKVGPLDILLYRTHKGTPFVKGTTVVPSSLPEAELAPFPVETDLTAALAWRPQAVIIANPTALHLDVAIPAAESGCHIFVEKPISHSLERINQLRAALHRSGGQLLVGYHFRFHPGLQKVKDLLSQQAIGRPLSVRIHWGEYLPNWHPWEDYRKSYSARADLGGGVTLTLSHTLDYVRWLLGEVDSLWAFSDRLGNLELSVEDTIEIGLKFKNRILGSVHMDYNQQPPAHTLEIVGTLGTLRWDNTDGHVVILRPGTAGRIVSTEPAERTSECFPAPAGFERNDLFLAEMRHFLAVARLEHAPACTLDDASEALRLALAALQSAQQGLLINMQAF